MTYRFLIPVLAGLALAGCNRGVQNEAAVRQGVIDYLSQRSDLNTSQMDVDVTAVSFRENEADATVAIRPKGGGQSQGMQIRYTLERKGSRWVVKGKGAGAQQHAAPAEGGGMPPGHPPMTGGSQAGAGQPPAAMPPGHPPVQQEKGAEQKK